MFFSSPTWREREKKKKQQKIIRNQKNILAEKNATKENPRNDK